MNRIPIRGSATTPPFQPLPAPRGILPGADASGDASWIGDEQNVLRRFGFYLTLVYLFLRVSLLHEILTFHFGLNLYLIAVTAPPAIAAALFSGGFRRITERRLAWFWIAFLVWQVVCIPFSTWIGGSLQLVFSYLRVDWVALIIVGGLTLTLAECMTMMHVVGLAAAVNVLSGRFFSGGDGSRLSLEFGSIANANDYAAHLLLTLPFLLYAALTARSKTLRIGALVLLPFGLYVGASAASRGAMIALAAVFLFVVIRAPGRMRFVMLTLLPILGFLTFSLLPDYARQRYFTLFGEDAQQEERLGEAVASADTRAYLLRTSIKFTFQNPIVGVGPGQFGNWEGMSSRQAGKRGTWQMTHNSYTQVSSESGLPGFFLYVSAIVGTFILLNRTFTETRADPRFRNVSVAAWCLMISMTGFCVSILFLSLAYGFHLPAISGLAIALSRAARREMALAQRRPAAASAPAGAAPVRLPFQRPEPWPNVRSR